MNIYVASSWRNEERQQAAVKALRKQLHTVYDFRHPAPNNEGFGWRQIDPDPAWLQDPERFRTTLASHDVCAAAFKLDFTALSECDACVLVLPCGRSAHLELGHAVGAGKRTYVWLDDPLSEPELMYLMCDGLATSLDDIVSMLEITDFDLRPGVALFRFRPGSVGPSRFLTDESMARPWRIEAIEGGQLVMHPHRSVSGAGSAVFRIPHRAGYSDLIKLTYDEMQAL